MYHSLHEYVFYNKILPQRWFYERLKAMDWYVTVLLQISCKFVQEVNMMLTCSRNRCGSSSRPLSNPVESASGMVESDELLAQPRPYFVALGDNNNDSLLSCIVYLD